MRRTVRIAVWLSVAALVVPVLYGVALVDSLNKNPLFGGEPGNTPLWRGALIGLYYSIALLAFIWLTVLVVYVVRMAVRVLKEGG
jgi:uncharacterized BrkB/YihY/UPF0761 family membrane protein